MDAVVDLGLRKQKSGKVSRTGGSHIIGLRHKNNFKNKNPPHKKEWKQARHHVTIIHAHG